MKKEVKAKWIKALRSDRYEQGTSALFLNGCYCCLGVIAKELGAVSIENVAGNGGEYLNDEWLEKTGLSHDEQILLAEMNDGKLRYEGHPHDFFEIADYIEKNIPGE